MCSQDKATLQITNGLRCIKLKYKLLEMLELHIVKCNVQAAGLFVFMNVFRERQRSKILLFLLLQHSECCMNPSILQEPSWRLAYYYILCYFAHQATSPATAGSIYSINTRPVDAVLLQMIGGAIPAMAAVCWRVTSSRHMEQAACQMQQNSFVLNSFVALNRTS